MWAAVLPPTRPGGAPGMRCDVRVNNAVSVFVRDDPFLPFYAAAREDMVRVNPADRLGPLNVSTEFLTDQHQLTPLSLLTDVGSLGPLLIHELTGRLAAPPGAKPGQCLRAYAVTHGHPVRVANLCASLASGDDARPVNSLAGDEAVVELLLRTRGEAVNQYAGAGAVN